MPVSGAAGTLVIVGSGPIGMTCALLLKDRFDEIVLLERQTKERFLTTHGFTFPIVFSPAAIAVLERVGAWEAIQRERSPFFGVVVHKRVAGRDFTWTVKQDGVYSHWRNHIVESLYERVTAEGIDVRFESQLEGIDFERGVCREATLGEVPFDLLLGADGIHSQTRGLIAEAHPDFAPDEFSMTLLDNWFAYRLPAEGEIRERYLGGDAGIASHVFVDNLSTHRSDRFRAVTTGMREPDEEISVLFKYAVDADLDHAKELNRAFIGDLVDAEALDEAWETEGYAGKYEHVHAPTFHLGRAVLVGDAAHGLESTGDLINVGLNSVATLADMILADDDIPAVLDTYDATVGASLRTYSEYALRRSREQIKFEVTAFEIGAMVGLTGRHPSLWGIFEDDFEVTSYMEAYRRDLQRARVGTAVLAAAGLVVVAASGIRRRLLS